MRYSIIISFLFFSKLISAQQASVPYIFYEKDSVLVHTVGTATRLKEKPQTVFVKFAGHPEWSFTVPLKNQLKNEPSEFNAAGKLFVVSDIEGEFEAFRALLLAGKVVDEKYNWQYGNGHLVICGDLFDRGENVTEYLWLLYKLEQDAELKGGYVHVILGNHDIMNLSGDYRFVQPKYFDEAKRMGVEYKDLFTVNSELGRWLRTKNIIEKIGNELYLHAGVSAQVNALQYSLSDINLICRPFYDVPMKNIPDSIKVFFYDDGLFWYRGYFTEPFASRDQVDSTLSLYDVSTIIAGHTIMQSITTFYDGKVVGIDVNQHEGKHQALVIENKKFFRLNDKGNKKVL